MTQAPDGWEARLTRVIAGEIRRHRQQRGMSAQQLADRCEQLGFPVARSVLANLENGRRDAVSVAELLVLARALDVSPILLAFPLGMAECVEGLPGETFETWSAVLWFSGDAALTETPGGLDIDWLDWTDNGAVVPLYLRHVQLVEDLIPDGEPFWVGALRPVGPDGYDEAVDEAVDATRDTVKRMEGDLRAVRARMRQLGLMPPALPARLAHVDHKGRSRGSR